MPNPTESRLTPPPSFPNSKPAGSGPAAMGTPVLLTPLSGVYGETPLLYLVAVDGFNILLDCGWSDQFDLSLLQPLSKSVHFSPFLSRLIFYFLLLVGVEVVDDDGVLPPRLCLMFVMVQGMLGAL